LYGRNIKLKYDKNGTLKINKIKLYDLYMFGKRFIEVAVIYFDIYIYIYIYI